MFFADGGARLFQDRAGKLIANLPGAIAGEEEPVHQVRVASRRLRVLLPILAAKPDGKKVRRLRRRLKKLIRVGGLGRDLDICVRLFDEHLLGEDEPEPEVKVLRRRLVAARSRGRRKMARGLVELDLESLRKDLTDVLERGPEDMFVAMARYRRARDEGAAALLDAMDRAGDRFDAPALHGVRKLGRRMRYVAEVGAAFREDAAGAPGKFRKIQDELGRVQDAHVLAVQLKRHAATAARLGQDRVASRAREISSGFTDLSRGLHHGYLAMDPAAEVRKALSLLGHRQTAA